jgi:hypothetical protein
MHPRVFWIHGGERWNTHEVLRQTAYPGAGQAIAPGIEGRPGHYDIWSIGLEGLVYHCQPVIGVLAHKVIAADEGGDDGRRALPLPLEGLSRAYRPGHNTRRCVGLLLTTDPPEELIEIMDNTDQLILLATRESLS